MIELPPTQDEPILADAVVLARARLPELRRQADSVKRLKELKAAFGIDFYRPHMKQHKFHVCAKTGRFLRTGNRFGKSECGIVEDIAWCLGGRTWYRNEFDILDGKKEVFQHHEGGRQHPFVTAGIPQHPVKGLVLAVSWKKVEEIFTNITDDPKTTGKLWKFLPKNALKQSKVSRSGHLERVLINRPAEFGGGVSTLCFDTIESWGHNKLTGESGDWDFIHIDEPIPEEMFYSYARGLMDRDGSFWFTCTPYTQIWINDMFIPDARQIGDTGLGVATEKQFVITGSTYDNPHRNEKGVETFTEKLNAEQRACRIEGEPLELAGNIYKEFKYDEHILSIVPAGWEDFHLPPKTYTIRVAWDVCGANRPQAFLYAATAPDETIYFYDEQYFEALMEPNLALMKQKIEGRYMAEQLVDPMAMIKNAATDSYPVIDLAATFELFFDAGSKDKTTGIAVTRDMLKERNPITKRPRILFSPKLKRLIWEFAHYVYNPDTQEPIDKHNDQLENLRRLLLTGCAYIEPTTSVDPDSLVMKPVSHNAIHNSRYTYANGR